ncbi:MAG: nicotinate-nucleotide adenylyltransferase [Bacillota bacterium]
MSKKLTRLGIMGGTFDPIHYGHLVTAEAARERYDLELIIFVPAGNPPHKKGYVISSSEDRFMMTSMAIATNPYFEICDHEIKREGYSYAVDTVARFQEEYGAGVELFFITGADAIVEILTWKNVEELVYKCRFIAATRPGFDLVELQRNLDMLPLAGRHRIHPIEIPGLAISSTDIRLRVAEKRTIKYLLPEVVEKYIYDHNLYNRESGCHGK